MTAILGLSAFYHDSAAALVVGREDHRCRPGGTVQPREIRRELPAQAIAYCLGEAGLTPDQLDYIAFYDKPLTKFERLLETYLAYAPAGLRQLQQAMPVWLKQKLLHATDDPPGPRRMSNVPAPLPRPPREPRGQRFLPVPLRGSRDPDPGRCRRVEHRHFRHGRGNRSS